MKGSGREMPPKPQTWWEANSPSEEIINLLQEPLIEFFKRAYDTEYLKIYSSGNFRSGDDEGLL
ncbi:hypothetical protein BDW59DRAFT_166917 [Aspergillus cavernicola]|uniref:Uncharacterized protein n=1 Tax=Aspergillus cavernicola TaxID=176166 RepID=A0ABR4HHV7_9EURO